MESDSIISALILGVVEGLTEFIPVSSTGHILLLGHFLGFESTGKTFEVLIQLGAILAIVTIYFHRLVSIAKALPTNAAARRFVAGVTLAFLPAAFAGVYLHSLIKTVLFESPMLICIMLILGGFALLWVDRKASQITPRFTDIEEYPIWLCLVIGLFQCLALVPGVSRSGATIAGSLLMGTDKRSAAEFTFFLAMPTMGGAFVYDLYKNIDHVSADDLLLVAVGFAAAFVMGAIVVRYLLDFVSKHGFAPFAYWRIFIGTAGLICLFLYTPPAHKTVAAERGDSFALEVDIDRTVTGSIPPKKPVTIIAKQPRDPAWPIGIKGDRLEP